MGEYDLTVIGGGSSGLTVAIGAANFGARVALIEKNKPGGDCLHYGCVPTKALIRSALVAHGARQARTYGIRVGTVEVDMPSIMSGMRRVVNTLAEHDSVERLQALGVHVFQGTAEFVNANEIAVGETRLHSNKMVLATGSRGAVPAIPGLSETGFITHVEALERESLPKSLVILGGGPIGLEFAQVFGRLGAMVTVIEAQKQILPREDAQAADIVHQSLEREGIRFILGGRVVQVSKESKGKSVTVEKKGTLTNIPCEEIFVATGRKPNTELTGLQAIGIEVNPTGIVVDTHLQTTVPHIYAAGDVIGGLQFTHVAGYEGKVVLRNTLFPFRRRVDYRVVPWVIFTDPEIAHVGLTEYEAREKIGKVHVYTLPMRHVDRAVIDGSVQGMVKVITDPKGQIVGAHIVGSHAGDLIQELVLAMHVCRQVKLPAFVARIMSTAFPTKSGHFIRRGGHGRLGCCQNLCDGALLANPCPQRIRVKCPANYQLVTIILGKAA